MPPLHSWDLSADAARAPCADAESSDCCTQACQAALHSVVQLCIAALSPVLPPLSEDRQVAEVIQVSLNIS